MSGFYVIFSWVFGGIRRLNEPDYDDEDFIWAVINGEAGKVWVHLQNGVNVNTMIGETGLTALQHAVMAGHENLVKLLLLQPDIVLMATNAVNGLYTPLHFAIIYRRLRIAQMLYEYEPLLIEERDIHGMSCLHIACSTQTSPDLLSWLLTLGLDTEVVDENGLTPLQWAARSSNRTTRTLIAAGAHVDGSPQTQSVSSPLRIAINHGTIDLVTYLIDQGAKVEFTVPIQLGIFINGRVTGWVTEEFASENLATVALRSVRIYEPQSIDVAEQVILASPSPPNSDSIFEFYGAYFLKSTVGQRELMSSYIRNGLLDRHINNIYMKRMGCLCISITGSGQKIANKEELRNRFQWEEGVFDQLVELCEDISLKRLSAIVAKRLVFTRSNNRNVTVGLKEENLHPLYNRLITMDWALRKYAKKLANLSNMDIIGTLELV